MSYNRYQAELLPLIAGPMVNAINWLMENGLIKQQSICNECRMPRKKVPSKRTTDGTAWRCMSRGCRLYKNYTSIREGSFFHNLTIDLRSCISIIWKWGLNCTQEHVLNEVAVAPSSVKKIYAKLRACCKKYFERNPVRLGGDGVICQIDESLFRHKPKNHRGRAAEFELWVFGMIECVGPLSKVFLTIVPNRSSDTLLPIIHEISREGTIIVSDKWAGYRRLQETGIHHLTVNHSLHFVDPITGIHTQNIESYWSKLKLRVKTMKGVRGSVLKDFLIEWMWRDNIHDENFDNLIELIKIYI